MNSKYDVEQIDAESLLWQILELNKVEEIRIESSAEGDQYGVGTNFKFVPWSKTPLLYEPVVSNKRWNINGHLYFPGENVKDLLILIANVSVDGVRHCGQAVSGFKFIDVIVTFVTKNRRISVDKVEV